MTLIELRRGCCGCRIRNTVCLGLFLSFCHGIFAVVFVFSSSAYPPFYYVDYMFGGCGAGLLVFSFISMCMLEMKRAQCIRGFFGFFTTLLIIGNAVTNYYYTIERWHDVMVTPITKISNNFLNNLPDKVWMSLAIISCIHATFLIVYIPYICSFMCRPWKSYLFQSEYVNSRQAFGLLYRSNITGESTLPGQTNPR